MSHAIKTSLATLVHRAEILQSIRRFFAERQILEVETPLLYAAGSTDLHLHSFTCLSQKNQRYYLQTSPEFAMKRLLAKHQQSIYQLCKAFRQEELGQYHQQEFTILEWYRIGYDHHQLMQEVDQLLQHTLQTPQAKQITYADLFQQTIQINPHETHCDELAQCAKKFDIDYETDSIDTWLQLLLSHVIEPQLGEKQPIFIYDFPASQAALAKIRPGNPAVAERFEVYYRGIELANGFHELTDATEQRQRFINDNQQRKQLSLPEIVMDEKLLAALSSGMPDCAGVALGFDRLVMLATQARDISTVVALAEKDNTDQASS